MFRNRIRSAHSRISPIAKADRITNEMRADLSRQVLELMELVPEQCDQESLHDDLASAYKGFCDEVHSIMAWWLK